MLTSAATAVAQEAEPGRRFGFVPESIRDSVSSLDLGAPLQWQVPVWFLVLIAAFGWLCLHVWRKFNPTPLSATTGTALSDPTKLPPPRKAAPAVTPGKELGEAFKSCRRALIGVGIFSGVSNILMLSGSLYMMEVYDRVLPSRSIATLVGLSLLVVVLYAGQGALDFIRARTLGRIGAVFDARLSRRAYDLATRLPLWKGDLRTGMQPLRDLDAVRGFLSGLGPTAFFDLPWIPLYLVVIFLFHPVLGIAALIGAIGLVALTLFAGRRTAGPSRVATEIGTRRFSLAEMSRRNGEAVYAMGMSGRIGDRFERANRDFNASQLAVSDVATGYSSISKVLRMVLQSAMLGIGAYLVIIGQATAGVMIAGSILVGRALAPVDLAISQWKSFVTARESWARLSTMLASFPNDPRPMALPKPSARLTVEAVMVAAPGTERKLVQDVTFSLEAGQALGVIGPSGSGKSTLARALVGAWRIGAGRIRIDNADLLQWSPDDLGRHIGYLPQDVSLFAGTVADNISRFDTEPNPELIIAAAKAAGVHDLILSLPQGYSTDVGELGTALSGGQRQRIALARALYGEPFLVVLDEPNSNLDADGDAALAAAIEAIRRRGGIVVIVAHRPSALAGVSHVLFLLNGKVQAFGPKDQVLANLFPRPKPVGGGAGNTAAGGATSPPRTQKSPDPQVGRIADRSKES